MGWVVLNALRLDGMLIFAELTAEPGDTVSTGPRLPPRRTGTYSPAAGAPGPARTRLGRLEPGSAGD